MSDSGFRDTPRPTPLPRSFDDWPSGEKMRYILNMLRQLEERISRLEQRQKTDAVSRDTLRP